MDPAVGKLHRVDILIECGRIVAIGPELTKDGATEVDAEGTILMPGLLNACMHTWQTCLRDVTSNLTLIEYFRNMHVGLTTTFTAEDSYSPLGRRTESDRLRDGAVQFLRNAHVYCAG